MPERQHGGDTLAAEGWRDAEIGLLHQWWKSDGWKHVIKREPASLRQLAKETGISYRSLSRIKARDGLTTPVVLVKVAALYWRTPPPEIEAKLISQRLQLQQARNEGE